MDDPGTDTLRQMAPCWTLAGDERLLTILQNTHQRLVAKCQEANSQLEQMATALDDANITLQNVNNQFMALSSSQFIESRVYDDDADVATDTPAPKEPPKAAPPDELTILKRSIAVIESTHEVITILHDSDTESDSDDDLPNRLVMKPKDMYADRPLPYIIGSEPWKNKWHAGLMPEDTDTDSSTSKVDRESDQYSLSEPEEFDSVQHPKIQGAMPVAQHIRKVSETSSELPSEATPTTKPTPSDVASEIARRLGGGIPPPKVEPEPEYDEPAKPTIRKIYKPQEPIASTIFPDEPPPLEDQSEEEADIFADLHRNQPYKQPYARQYVTDELFGGDDTENDEGADIFSDFANQPSNITKPTSLFDAGPKPHMFDRPIIAPVDTQPRPAEQPSRSTEPPHRAAEQAANTIPDNNTADAPNDRGVKKPIGGISLFGSNKGTESIGAAILKRNRRKSSTSGDDSGNDVPEPTPPVKEQQTKKEKDIFDDLFAKSEAKKVQPKVNNVVKDIKQEIQRKTEEKAKKDKEVPKVVDLFSDNLFDDIDDIFTTNIVKNPIDNKKSIFEDDDDLFSEIAEPKTVKQDVKASNDIKKSLFDSDDDLFSESASKGKPSISNKTESITKVTKKPSEPTTVTKVTKITETTSIFDDDEDNIFSNIKPSKLEVTKVQNVTINKADSNLTKTIEASKKIFNSPSLFDDDDDDESDLFAEPVKSTGVVQKNEVVNKVSVEISKKTELNTTEDVSKENTEVRSSYSEKDLLPTSSITEANDSKEIKNYTDTEPSVKTDKLEADTINKQRDTEVNKNKVDNEVTKAENDCEFNNASVVHKLIKENVEPNNINTNNKPTAIQKMLEDDTDKTSEDDFSEQDFDDEPIPETKPHQNKISNTVPDIKVEEKHTVVDNIFDNSALEEDIFASQQNVPRLDKPELTNKERADNSETSVDNKTEVPTSDIFADIITEPPAFEKPKEPKKSKNVNALFDDDSDDEALFFKKEDVISDEKPEDFTVKQDRLFDIFVDEPPDDDFTKIDDNFDEDLFSTVPKPKIPQEKPHASISHHLDDDLVLPDDLPVPDDTPLSNNLPIEEDEAATNDDNADKNVTTIFKAEKQHLPQDSEVNTKIKESSEDLIKLPSTKINNSQPVKGTHNIHKDDDDIFKEPVSLVSSVTEKQDNMSDDDEELFKSLPAQLSQQKTNTVIKNQDTDYRSDEELFKSLPIIEKSQAAKEIPKPSLANKDIFKLPLQRSNSTNLDLKPENKADVKKVGKLKVGLNINVNALLPGASPKKVKPIDSPDGQTQSSVEPQKVEPIMNKSVSFDGKPESEILDNKLSKERPRIQVKRRPSTRKARREAVRKSGIDFGDDSTDNSSSIDDPPKPQPEIVQQVYIKSNEDKDISPNDENSAPVKVKANDTPTKTEAQVEKVDIAAKLEPQRKPVKSDSTTKIVYILNDEDIFNTSAIESPETKGLPATQTSAVKDLGHTEVKKSDILNSSLDLNPGIKTLGNTYKATKVDERKNSAKSLFGEDENSDNDELFKSKKPVVKSRIFDSDSEEELFGTSKKVEKVTKVEKVKEVKGSLFGDDDDDDDLFGVKTKKSAEPQPQPSKPTPSVKETAKSTQPVFEDPLSMFGDDD